MTNGTASADPLACPACGHHRQPQDEGPFSQCSACGVTFAQHARDQRTGAARPASALRTASSVSPRVVFGVILGAAGIVGIIGLAANFLPKPKTSPPLAKEKVYEPAMARQACEHFVSQNLKAPATARFSPHAETSIAGSDVGPYTVVGYVDSQNGFGALIRSKYACTLSFSGDLAQLSDISIN